MDALSRLLENINLYETRFYCLQGNGEWSYSLKRNGHNTVIFYLVIEGCFCIDVMGEEREATSGDIIVLSNTHQHVAYSQNNKVSIEDTDELIVDHEAYQKVLINENDAADGQLTRLVLIECMYDKEITRPLIMNLPHILPERKFISESGQGLLDLTIKLIHIESSSEHIGKTAMINRMTGIILIDCLRTYIEDLPEASDNWLSALTDPYLSKALAYMHNLPEDNWTIHKLAEVAGMSRSSFAERFKQKVGVPPLTYLMNYRLRLAAKHLRLQQYSISQIGGLIGYASDSTFSQAFKRVYGMSPRRYRQQYTINDAS